MDGPFGVVSAAELIGILLFSVYVIWAVSAYTIQAFQILAEYQLSFKEERYNYVPFMIIFFISFGLETAECGFNIWAETNWWVLLIS